MSLNPQRPTLRKSKTSRPCSEMSNQHMGKVC